MRSDMAKVIVERPRLGGHKYKSCRRLEKNDFDTSRQSIKGWIKSNKLDDKVINENLRPLERFLLSQVGQLWTKVFSDMKKHINPNNAVQAHIWQHAKDYVATNTFIRNEKVYIQHNGNEISVTDKRYHLGMIVYVHPITGILHKITSNKDWWKPDPKVWDETNRKILSKDQILMLKDGRWHVCFMQQCSKYIFAGYESGNPDFFFQRMMREKDLAEAYGFKNRICKFARTLSHRELQNFGLKNTL